MPHFFKTKSTTIDSNRSSKLFPSKSAVSRRTILCLIEKQSHQTMSSQRRARSQAALALDSMSQDKETFKFTLDEDGAAKQAEADRGGANSPSHDSTKSTSSKKADEQKEPKEEDQE